MKKNIVKTNSSYRYGCFHVGRTDMWGNYCPETGEYYLACNDEGPIVGPCISVLATCLVDEDGYLEEAAEAGYSYEVVRELLQLGHLTKKTLAVFIAAGGDVWWDQPNYSKEEIKMGKISMQCGCYLNNRGFKIGRKYATVYNASNDKTLARVLLTNRLCEKLEAIKAEYPPQDARRTAKAIDVIFEEI